MTHARGPEIKVGEMLPGTKYRVVKWIGAGGMGVVYEVEKPPNIRGVLKLMSRGLTDQKDLRLRFFDEVRVIAELEHPNIVRVFDYDSLADGTPFYVMEVLSGRTVRDALAAMGRVPPRVAYEITRQLLEALQCAHTHEIPVIHRDIKPDNIFLHAPRHGEPVVKLIDFGVSAIADRKQDRAFAGTPAYAAPEQILCEPSTPSSDLYAVGLVLYEMLAGVGPFDHHPDVTAVLKAQCEEIPAPVSKFAPWIPPAIVTLIASALAKDPRNRPRDAYEFAERLYELEWVTEGQNPRDLTALAASPGPPPVDRERVGPATPRGPGPLSLVLSRISSVTQDDPGSGRVALSPTTPGLGEAPASLGTPPQPVVEVPSVRGPLQHVFRPAGRDTFSSQESDARSVPRSRIGLLVVAGLLCFAAALTVTLSLLRRHDVAPTTSTPAKSTLPVESPPPAVSSAPASIESGGNIAPKPTAILSIATASSAPPRAKPAISVSSPRPTATSGRPDYMPLTP